jgi:hypothetical protein
MGEKMLTEGNGKRQMYHYDDLDNDANRNNNNNYYYYYLIN